MSLSGPAVIEEAKSTTVIGPGGKATIDADGNIVVTIRKQGRAMSGRSKNAVSQLEVAWNTLISIASEQAAAMVNSSFSAVLGEMEDLSAGVFDANGTMMAQSVQGAPGHLGSLSLGLKHFCRAFPEKSLHPGRRADHQRSVARVRPQARHLDRDAGLSCATSWSASPPATATRSTSVDGSSPPPAPRCTRKGFRSR